MSRVTAISSCLIGVSKAPWQYGVELRARIVRFWKKAQADNPRLYNGALYMLTRWRLVDGRFEGEASPCDFASFLYWREEGFPETGARNCFGSSVLRSSDGALLFGRMAPHTATAGLVYPVGGSLASEDVSEGRISIESNLLRELFEETGLKGEAARREPGYLLVEEGPRMAIAAQFVFDMDARALRRAILFHIETADDAELDEVVIFRRKAFARHHRMPGYARMIVEHLLAR